MIFDFVYGHSIAVSGAVLVIVAVALSWLGLAITASCVDLETRSQHTDVSGITIAIVGVFYAVLLAFVAVAVWQNYGTAGTAVDQEVNFVSNLYRDAVAMPDATRSALRDDLTKYLTTVVTVEWPSQQQGNVSKAGWKLLDDFHRTLAKAQPQTPGATVVHAQMLRTLDRLYDARRARILSEGQALANIVWVVLILGGAITVTFSFFFGVPSFRIHLMMTGLLTASLAFVFVLILAFDEPFRGSLAISPQPFQDVQSQIAALPPGD